MTTTTSGSSRKQTGPGNTTPRNGLLHMTTDFTNRVVLITGGSRGIGRATALRLASEGADIAFSYASRAGDAEKTAAAIRALGRRAVYRRCNVANPEDIKNLQSLNKTVGWV